MQKQQDEDAKKGISKKKVAHLRENVHREQIKNILDDRENDLNEVQKAYNKTRNIIDWEEVRESQSKMQRKNLAKVLRNKQQESSKTTSCKEW